MILITGDARPRIAISPQSLKDVAIGSSLVITCRAISGYPEPTVTWKK